VAVFTLALGIALATIKRRYMHKIAELEAIDAASQPRASWPPGWTDKKRRRRWLPQRATAKWKLTKRVRSATLWSDRPESSMANASPQEEPSVHPPPADLIDHAECQVRIERLSRVRRSLLRNPEGRFTWQALHSPIGPGDLPSPFLSTDDVTLENPAKEDGVLAVPDEHDIVKSPAIDRRRRSRYIHAVQTLD
jgi:hypothetical protein